MLTASLCACALGSCSSVRWRYEKPVSVATAPGTGSEMSRAIGRAVAAHPGKSGLHVLALNEEAFAARLVLVNEARESLDVQTYLLHWDMTGRLLLDRLLRAADRGVRVRLLVDDIDLLGSDHRLRAIDAHPRVEVRLFNPFFERDDSSGISRAFQFLIDSKRLNRRMHNKLFAVDNRVAIIGGRNVGNEYFTSRLDPHFKDLDVLMVGPAVRSASEMFDLYWNSEWAMPVAAFRSLQPRARDLKRLKNWRDELEKILSTDTVRQKLIATGWPERLRRGTVDFTWTAARLVYDLPGKVRQTSGEELPTPLGPQMLERARRCRHDLTVVSSYFVPGHDGVGLLRELRQRGVRVRVVTNSLAATDVPLVHGGYERYRTALLRAGVEIYEMKPDAKPRLHWRGRSLDSATCLHAKAFLFDDTGVVIGSFNVDPRSANLNTEVAVVTENARLNREVRALVDEATHPEVSYRVTLDAAGRVAWMSESGGRPLVERHEPRAGPWRKFMASLVRLLPLEGQL